MVRITSFIMSDGVMNIPDQNGQVTQVLSRPLQILRPQFIPSAFSFCFAVGVSGIDLTAENNVIKMVITDPEGKEVSQFNDISVPTDPNCTLPVDDSGCLVCMDVRNIGILMEGKYLLQVKFNEILIGTCEIPVYQGAK